MRTLWTSVSAFAMVALVATLATPAFAQLPMTRDVVILGISSNPASNACGGAPSYRVDQRLFPDGTVAPFSVPENRVLYLDGITWNSHINGGDYNPLGIAVTSNPAVAYGLELWMDAWGNVNNAVNSPSHELPLIPVRTGMTICVTTNLLFPIPNFLRLHGVLVYEQTTPRVQCAGRIAAIGAGDGEFAVQVTPTGTCTNSCNDRFVQREQTPFHRDQVSILLEAVSKRRRISIGYDPATCEFSNASVFY